MKSKQPKTNVLKCECDSSKIITYSHDYTISIIRLIAFLYIVICHILQYYDNVFAWWFNVGVQIFLFISGFLYGKKYCNQKIAFLQFYKKRIVKILLPYYIVILPVILLHILYLNEHISKMKIVQLFICNTTLKGGGHLWFVATILLCYLLTPIFSSLFDNANKKEFFIRFLLLFIGMFLFFHFYNSFYNVAWLICYFLGHVYGTNENKGYISKRIIGLIVLILSLQNILQIMNDYHHQMISSENPYYKIWCDFNHVWLGIVLFIVFRMLFSKINYNNHTFLKNLLDVSDKYSYEGYLVHQFIILGPFSLMSLTSTPIINIIIILILICIFAIALKMAESLVFRIIQNKSGLN